MNFKFISFVLLFEITFHVAWSQDSLQFNNPLRFSVSANFNQGAVLVHSHKAEDTNHAYPIGFVISLNWQRTNKMYYDDYRSLPRQSLQIAYVDYDKSLLGRGLNVSYSLEPHFMLSEGLSFYPKISAGLGFQSNPYDSIRNPHNESYNLPVNAFLAFGFGFRCQFSKSWAANLTGEFQHLSNGGLYKPNIGLNWLIAGIGIEYSPFGLELKKFCHTDQPAKYFKSRRFDVQVYGIRIYGVSGGKGRFYQITGLNLTRSWQVSRIHAWTAALEAYQDSFLRDYDKASSANRLGVLAGHEFLLGKYVFSQQIGYYLAGSQRDFLMYHRWGLQYFFVPRCSVGINMLVHGHVADFTDIRLAYSLQRSGK